MVSIVTIKIARRSVRGELNFVHAREAEHAGGVSVTDPG
jgi:hypothetical protein